MNLTVLEKSRRAPVAGDIFAMLPPDAPRRFLYGRVIATDATSGPMKDCILIYIYRARSPDVVGPYRDATQLRPVPELFRGQLLVPPMMTNKLPWTKGYFAFVEHRPLTPMDRLPQHCFRDTRGWYYDEYSNRLPGPVVPVGGFGLESYRTIDDEVSKALGIPLAPD